MSTPVNSLGAFCTDRKVFIPGAGKGQLSGLTFAAKDVFDIAGFRTGAGNPDWLRTHPPAPHTASTVQHLLDAGATLVGKTHTDELTFSLNGENHHYGTPVNPNAPGRIPGGSSSGSASATAGGLVDFALGTDTGGSVRLPASNCGVYGFRPTHGAIANDHVVPLAPSFDTVGWFARDPVMLSRVGDVLLKPDGPRAHQPRLLIAGDAFELALPDTRPSLNTATQAIRELFGAGEEISLFDGHEEEWMSCFRLIQGIEVWRSHGDWIRSVVPDFGQDIRERFEWAASLDATALPAAQEKRADITRGLERLLGRDGVLCLPASPSIALPASSTGQDLEQFRFRALTLLCVASLAGLPQISLPIASHADCPLGLSLIGPRHSDRWLLKLALKTKTTGTFNT